MGSLAGVARAGRRARAVGRAAALIALAASAASAAQLLDLEGRTVEPLPRGDSGVVVLVFARTDCPISNRYAPELRRLHDEFAPRGVRWWIVYPDPAESVQSIRRHLQEYDVPGRAVRDPQHALVRETGVRVTPEVAVYRDGSLVYRGRIDDRYVDFGTVRAAATRHDLEQALEAALGGEPPAERFTDAVGCYIGDLR